MAERHTLHISKLEAFRGWLAKDGWEIEKPKGDYEVLRARKQGRQNPLIVYTKSYSKEHLSVMDRDKGVVYAFLRDCNKAKTNGDRIRSMSDEELTKIILCPYDTAGKPIDIMPCIKDGNIQELVPPEDCKRCMLEWLQSEVEE